MDITSSVNSRFGALTLSAISWELSCLITGQFAAASTTGIVRCESSTEQRSDIYTMVRKTISARLLLEISNWVLKSLEGGSHSRWAGRAVGEQCLDVTGVPGQTTCSTLRVEGKNSVQEESVPCTFTSVMTRVG